MKSLGCILVLLFSIAVPLDSSAEIKRIENGPLPTQTIRNWHLKEVWRAGPEGKDYLFGWIIDVARDESGRIYLLDYQQQETFVFDLSGKLTAVLGGKGEGPGETTMASNLLVGPNHFGLLNRFPAEIVRLDSEGDPAGSVHLQFPGDQNDFLGCRFGRYRHGKVVVGLTRPEFDGQLKSQTDYLVGCSEDGTLDPIYVGFKDADHRGSQDGVADEGHIYDPLDGRWDLDEKGRVWLGPNRDEYLLRVVNEKGQVVLETSRLYDRPARGEAELRKVRANFERKWARSGLPVEVAPHAPCIERLWIQENPWGTEVWVESGASHHDLPPGVMVRYDIFNLEGIFTHQVDIVGDADPMFDRWYLVGNNRLIMVRNASDGGFNEDDPKHPRYDDGDIEVISYCIVWEE